MGVFLWDTYTKRGFVKRQQKCIHPKYDRRKETLYKKTFILNCKDGTQIKRTFLDLKFKNNNYRRYKKDIFFTLNYLRNFNKNYITSKHPAKLVPLQLCTKIYNKTFHYLSKTPDSRLYKGTCTYILALSSLYYGEENAQPNV